jgi:hypothetical protein
MGIIIKQQLGDGAHFLFHPGRFLKLLRHFCRQLKNAPLVIGKIQARL